MQTRSAMNPMTLGFVFGALLVVCSTTSAQEDPILAAVKAQVKDPAKPFTMLVQVEVKEGETKKFEMAFAKAIQGTRKEKGNIAYQLNRDTKKPTSYLVYERWKSLDALKAHLETKHIKTLLSQLPDLVAGPPEVKVLIPAGE